MSSCSNSRKKCSYLHSIAEGLTTITISHPCAILGKSTAIAPLICRLIRLRLTALLLTLVLIEIPIRLGLIEDIWCFWLMNNALKTR